MKFTAAAILAIAAGASAFENVTYTTEVVTAVTTFCPAATEITHAGTTYTITEATTLTITDCPCTITKPVTTVASLACVTCAAPSSSAAPVYTNGTGSYPTTGVAPGLPAGTGGVPVGGGNGGGNSGSAGGSTPTTSTGSSASSSSSSTPPIVTAGAGRAAVVSGAGLAGFLGLAAFLL
ncbi:hypothetical protein SLS53_006311 [Cytospora paraplurivora]|uniref:Clock-controlled protein 6 n=1 Tax=Cytospora paraplurivora TaxID=2898453 RepID=A0AAN9YEZ2_9PEZI